MARVTILIPFFNPGPMFEPCLESCLAQTHGDLELVLVDNNSTDGSANLARRVLEGGRVPFHIVNCAEQGPTHAFKAGVDKASGAYVQSLDADDTIDPDKVRLQAAALDAAPDYDVAYSDWIYRQHTKEGVREQRNFERQTDDMLLRILANDWMPFNVYFFRRKLCALLTGMALFRSRAARWADDRAYATAAAITGARFLYVPGAVSTYNRWSERQRSAKLEPHGYAQGLADMFAWFRELARAEEARGRKFSDEHWRLLGQDWTPVRPAPAGWSVTKRPDGKFELSRPGSDQRAAGGEAIKAFYEVLKDAPVTATIEDFCWLVMGRRKLPKASYPQVHRVMENFRALGFFEAAGRDARRPHAGSS